MNEWEVIRDKEDMVRRLAVPGGWLYQIQKGRAYIGHSSWGNWEPTWHPPYFVSSTVVDV
jgi:hypothetical protein